LREPFLKFIENNLPGKSVLISCGLPSTGKTTATREISRVTGQPMLRSDLIRLDVLKEEDIFNEKVASDPIKRQAVYDEMFKQADRLLEKHEGIILDATFISQALRKRAARIASGHGLPFIILETVCPREVALRRIYGRADKEYESNALTEQSYINNEQASEKVDLAELKKSYPALPLTHVTVDTTNDTPTGWYVTGVERR